MTDNHASLADRLDEIAGNERLAWGTDAAAFNAGVDAMRNAVRATLASLPSQQEEAARDVHAAHWLAIRPKVIEALAAEGLEILSNADGGVWLNRRKARTASAEPEPIEVDRNMAGEPPPATTAGQQAPEGWRLVPVEPTPEMCEAARAQWYGPADSTWASLYTAMLAAAPKAGKKQAPLTEEQIDAIYWDGIHDWRVKLKPIVRFARAIEAAHGIAPKTKAS